MNFQTENRFHDRLRKLRERKNLSPREVAERIKVPVSTYREWENGRAIQGTAVYAPLAELLSVSVRELLTGEVPTDSHYQMRTRIDAAIGTLEELKAALLTYS